jgi:hypothetical protein
MILEEEREAGYAKKGDSLRQSLCQNRKIFGIEIAVGKKAGMEGFIPL